MKKNDVFTFTAPNGVEVQAVVLRVLGFDQTGEDAFDYRYLCYGQNRLFTCCNMIVNRTVDLAPFSLEIKERHVLMESDISDIDVCVDYAILPDYDALFEDYNRTKAIEKKAEEERARLEEWEKSIQNLSYEETLPDDYPLWEQNMEKPDPDEGEDIFWDSCAEEHNKQEGV